jgi:nuclear polyadenylated RNA-binding protein 3
MTSGHYADEPHMRSEPALLSPASPKPLHFPAPTNIPVLDKMMDVGFNQTEPHMADPAMHDTELRPGAWQDPNAHDVQKVEATPGEEAATHPGAPSTAHASEAVSNMEMHMSNASPVGVGASAESVAQPTPSSYEPNPSATDSTSASASHHADLPAPLKSEVDVQALLQSLNTNSAQPTPAPASDNHHVAQSPSRTQPNHAPGIDESSVSAAGLGAPPSGLPPRPPPQEQPLINANYSHSQIRDYHPHAANSAYQNSTARSSNTAASTDPTSQTFAPPIHVSTESGAESSHANSTATLTQDQQAMYGANLNRMQGTTPLESRREYKIAAGLNLSEDDQPWTADTQRKYDKFIEDERKYVSEGRWEQFPYGSRLFVGNLSSERVTKRDIFHAFHRYGDLAQISIKQAYGFVQFLRPQDCAVALQREEGRQIRGKKIRK